MFMMLELGVCFGGFHFCSMTAGENDVLNPEPLTAYTVFGYVARVPLFRRYVTQGL